MKIEEIPFEPRRDRQPGWPCGDQGVNCEVSCG